MNAKAVSPSYRHFYGFVMILLSFIIYTCTSNNTEQPTESPYFYYFERDGHSTVKNTGQTCRNLIIQNFEIMVKGMAKEGAVQIYYEELYKYYDNHKKTISEGASQIVALSCNSIILIFIFFDKVYNSVPLLTSLYDS